MSNILHTIFVVLANLIGWGLLIAAVVGFIFTAWACITGKGNNKNNNSGLPWL